MAGDRSRTLGIFRKNLTWKIPIFFYREIFCVNKNLVVGLLKTYFKMHQCTICKSRNLEFVSTSSTRYFLSCPECGACFSAYLPKPKEICKRYIVHNYEEYLEDRRRLLLRYENGRDNWRGWVDWKIQTFKKLNLEEFEKETGNSRKALEVGCAEGKVLGILKKRGWNVVGVDVSEYMAHLCKESNFNIIVAAAEKMNFRDECFDLVVMFHALEHTVDPMLVTRNIFNMLKKGGKFIFEVPYFKSRKNFFADFSNISHLYFFSEKGIENMLRINGFNYLYKFIYEDQLHKPKRNICYLVEKR